MNFTVIIFVNHGGLGFKYCMLVPTADLERQSVMTTVGPIFLSSAKSTSVKFQELCVSMCRRVSFHFITIIMLTKKVERGGLLITVGEFSSALSNNCITMMEVSEDMLLIKLCEISMGGQTGVMVLGLRDTFAKLLISR